MPTRAAGQYQTSRRRFSPTAGYFWQPWECYYCTASYFVLHVLEFLKGPCNGGGGRKKRWPYRGEGYHDLTGDLLVSVVAMDRKEKEHTDKQEFQL